MFREMRRKQCEGSFQEAEFMLKKAPHGILGVAGDQGYPYTVPVSFVYQDGKIIQEALELILEKYSPKHIDSGKKYIKAEWANLKVVEIQIDHMTAKVGN